MSYPPYRLDDLSGRLLTAVFPFKPIGGIGDQFLLPSSPTWVGGQSFNGGNRQNDFRDWIRLVHLREIQHPDSPPDCRSVNSR